MICVRINDKIIPTVIIKKIIYQKNNNIDMR